MLRTANKQTPYWVAKAKALWTRFLCTGVKGSASVHGDGCDMILSYMEGRGWEKERGGGFMYVFDKTRMDVVFALIIGGVR